MGTRTVSVVIPNYNGEKLLKKYLPSVVTASKIKSNKIIEVIIVDDASTDDSVKILKSDFKTIRLFKHTKNRGFSSTVNLGVRMAKGDLICLLNSDVKVTKEFLPKAIDHFSDTKVFGVTLHEKGYGPSVGFFDKGFVGFKPGKEKNKVQETFWLSGGSSIFDRSKWMKLKGLDSELFSPFYYEDLDISYRAAKRGYKLLWEPGAHVFHEHEATVKTAAAQKQKNLTVERNQLLFTWKNITSQNLFRRHVRALAKRVIRHPGYSRVVFLALKKWSIVSKRRKKEATESVVSDEAIFAKFNLH